MDVVRPHLVYSHRSKERGGAVSTESRAGVAGLGRGRLVAAEQAGSHGASDIGAAACARRPAPVLCLPNGSSAGVNHTGSISSVSAGSPENFETEYTATCGKRRMRKVQRAGPLAWPIRRR